jgi:hypothetical protein
MAFFMLDSHLLFVLNAKYSILFSPFSYLFFSPLFPLGVWKLIVVATSQFGGGNSFGFLRAKENGKTSR